MGIENGIIYKYTDDEDGQLEVPTRRMFLKMALQGTTPTFWFLVDPESPKEKIKMLVYGTGQVVEDIENKLYVDTFFINGYVWHVFQDEAMRDGRKYIETFPKI